MKVGDLVVVVKPAICCGSVRRLGVVFRITGFTKTYGRYPCCGYLEDPALAASGFEDIEFNLDRLRVIPPLNELEAEKAVEHA